MRKRSGWLAVFVFFGCSSKSSEPTATPNDSGVADTGVVGDAKPDVIITPDGGVYPEYSCGPGPYVEEELKVYGQTIGAATKDAPKTIKFSLSACPEIKGETDETGYAILHMTVGKPNSIKLEAKDTGWLPTRWYERTPQAYEGSNYYLLMSDTSKAQLTGLDAGVILVDVSAPSGGTCTNDGVALSVEGHPEAVIKYRNSAAPFAPLDGATVTDAGGLATIEGLTGVAAGATVKVIGTKTGCDVVALASPGTVAIEPGVVSRVELLSRDVHVACGGPPWVVLSGTVANRETDGTAGMGVADATIDLLGCGSPVSTKSDAMGLWTAYVSEGLPLIRRTSATDYITSISSEQMWTTDYTTLNVALRKSAVWTLLMPGYDSTHGYAIVGIAAPTKGPCAGADGVAITVKGQPDVKVIYADGEPPTDTKGTSTTKKGYAYLSGLTPGAMPKEGITGVKGMCTYKLDGGVDTGNGKIEAGALTSFTLYPVAP
ncbi:MAG: hypothetical protein ACXVEF_19900 [Polyangiales bacterium]